MPYPTDQSMPMPGALGAPPPPGAAMRTPIDGRPDPRQAIIQALMQRQMQASPQTAALAPLAQVLMQRRQQAMSSPASVGGPGVQSMVPGTPTPY